MKLNNLFESNIADVATKGFKTFLSDYASEGDSTLFVVFSNSKTADFKASDTLPFKNGMVAYPLKYVVENAIKFANIKSKYLTVVKLQGGVFVETLTTRHLIDLMNKVSFTSGTLKFHADNQEKTIEEYKKEYGGEYKFKLYTDLLPLVPHRHKPAYIACDLGGTMCPLSNKFGSIAFILNKFSYRFVSYYYNDNAPESNRRSAETTRKLAAFISSGLGSTLSSDKEIDIFTESFFWTNDGIEIRITKLYANQSSKEQFDHDGTSYIIECDTPNGIIIYNTSVTETFEHIKEEIAKRTKTLNRPSETWKPMSRDIFLTGSRFGFKALDQDKAKFIETIDKFYPKMRDYGLRNNINIPNLNMFGDMDKTVIFNIMDKFLVKQNEPLVAIKRIVEEGIPISELIGTDGNVKSERIDYPLLQKMALIYIAAKRITPNRTGWHIFNYV